MFYPAQAGFSSTIGNELRFLLRETETDEWDLDGIEPQQKPR
jgi:hypothetical protein